ncbi:outer membrane protein TolC precursor [mine drainage metagenome]|uniref:Outer membrane protein TolC n=1 Tax=mine drainage metagenome TaxID=410659 RepID=A0A1J5QEP2_9ZZZZ
MSLYKGRGFTDSVNPGYGGTTFSSHQVYGSDSDTFSIRQSVFNLANFASYKEAKATVAKSDALLAKDNISLISRVTGAYLDALQSTENIQYSQAQQASVQSQLSQAEQRYKLGMGTVTEVNEAKANLEDVKAKALEWVSNLEYSKRMLESLSGVYPEGLQLLNVEKFPLHAPEPDIVDQWIEKAWENNPDILAARQDIKVAMGEITKNRAGHYPTLDLVASRSYTSSDTNYTIGSTYNSTDIGFQLNIPIYSGGHVDAAVLQASTKLDQANEILTVQQRTVEADVRKYFNAIINGISKIQALEESVKSNELAVVGTQKGYEAGFRTNVEVLNAQEKLFAAKRDLAHERYTLIYAQIQLKQSTGVLRDADIQEISDWLSVKSVN